MTWRFYAQEAIQKAIAENPNASKAELRKAIDAAYPFGERAYHPYRAD